MNLILVRHADAIPRGEPGIERDEDRPLTDTGRQQSQALARALQTHQFRTDVIVSSPLVRAVETAEEIATVWGLPAENLLKCDHLAFGGRPRKLMKFLADVQATTITLVGHQPDIEELTGWLIGSRKAAIEFGKSGAA